MQKQGKIGQNYNVGSNFRLTNIDLSKMIYIKIKKIFPQLRLNKKIFEKTFDRPGHDIRYAINSKKIRKELNWKPTINFSRGIEETINWYILNIGWLKCCSKKLNKEIERNLSSKKKYCE